MWEINGEEVSNERDVMEYFGLKYPPMVFLTVFSGQLDTDLYKKQKTLNDETLTKDGELIYVDYRRKRD